MAKQLFVRIAGALGATSLALFFVSLIPFLGAGPTAGAGISAGPPAFTVDREFKGDRLPLPSQINSAVSRNMPTPQVIPVGCDASFSPISAPRLAYVFGRCVT
jgi:hypothetical protein